MNRVIFIGPSSSRAIRLAAWLPVAMLLTGGNWGSAVYAQSLTGVHARAYAAALESIHRADRISAQADLKSRLVDTYFRPVLNPSFPIDGPVFELNGSPFDPLIVKHATLNNIHPDLVRAVIKAESNFNPQATSIKGARGLMQLMPETARRYGVSSIGDPEQNISAGVRYLGDLLKMFSGDITLALSAYNAGEQLIARIKKIPPFLETREYVNRIGTLFDFQRSAYLTPR